MQSKNPVFVFLFVFVLTSAVLGAWSPLPNWVSPDERFTMSVALADLWDDGDLDLVAGNYNYPYNFDADYPEQWDEEDIGDYLIGYEYDNNGFLDPTPFTTTPRCIDCIAVADYDKDGDQDIAMGCVVGKGNDGGVWVFKNQKYVPQGQTPASNFQGLFCDDEATNYSWHPEDESYDAHCVRWVDFNCNGDLDLAALEVGGILHLYEGNGEGSLDNFDQIDLTDELEPYSIQALKKPCTTMEFGDIDGDGDLDVCVSLHGLPYIYKNMYIETSGAQIFTTEDIITTAGVIPEDCFCASFGWYDGSIALAVGSMTITGNQDHPDEFGWGNDLYTYFSGDPECLHHVAKSDLTVSKPQLVTDIKWGSIGTGDDMDLVAVSYANIYETEVPDEFSWDRGYEQIHNNITPESINSNDGKLPTDVWTDDEGNHDLSTSLALGDIDDPGAQTLLDIVYSCGGYTTPRKGIHYLDRFPFFKITQVSWRTDESDPWAIFEDDDEYCYNYDDGWFSIDNEFHENEDLWIRINYSHSTDLDLAVGNDGKNAVYFYDGGGLGAIPDPPLPYEHEFDPYTTVFAEYETPDEFATATDTNLMAQDGLGASAWENTVPQLPHCSMFAVSGSWGEMEIFRGHYFWDRLDKGLDFIYTDGSDHKATIYSAFTPEWTIGNYIFPPISEEPYDDDYRHRTSDERLHTMFVRNLVNRYRPGGLLGTIPDNDYDWGTWGATYFQFEFEAQWVGLHGYGFSPGSARDLSEKMYFEYQIIKDIDENLKVISPNSGNYNLGEPADKYVGTHIPFWNELNEIDSDLVPDNEGEACDRALWRFCDYVDVSMHCGLVPNSSGHYVEDKDPWISPTFDDVNHPDLRLGLEHQLWSFYTPGIDDYYRDFIGIEDEWEPVMEIPPDLGGGYCIKPFFIRDWQFFYIGHDQSPGDISYPQNDWIASELTKIFAIDVFPDDPDTNFYLVEYQTPWYIYDRAEVFDKCAEMLNNSSEENGFEFVEQVDQTIVHSYRFADPDEDPGYNNLVEFVRTDYGTTEPYFGQDEHYVTTDWDYIFQNNLPGFPPYPDADLISPIKLDAHTLYGDCFQKDAFLHTYPGGYTQIKSSFSGGEMGPQMIILKTSEGGDPDDYTQTVNLHEGWNLLSWHIWPIGDVGEDFFINEILPDDPEHSWFHDNPGGKVYDYTDDYEYWPLFPSVGNRVWKVDWAYFFDMDGSHTWDEFVDKPQIWEQSTDIPFTPSDAWNDHGHFFNSDYADYWFFMGYGAPGYCKLSSVPGTGYDPTCGDPADFDYEGPFHWLIWEDDEPNNYPLYVLKIVKDDEGRVYIPDPDLDYHRRPPFDNIGTLTPGRGYFLGFVDDEEYQFEGWHDWPQWENENLPPDPKSIPPQTASGSHFQHNRYTHWSFPVVIDTVDMAVCSLAVGDEIGAFDGEMCVGATVYTGEFPFVVVCWQDDKATPMILDGYIPSNPMSFIWYDASANAEIELALPPGIEAIGEDDPVAPTHSGFGCGLYARRQFTIGIAQVTQLPTEFKLCQNYPNPFNSITVIPLELPQRSRIKLEIFNIQGQLLGMPYETIYNPGWHKISWDASKLPSGIYFYRITAEGLEHEGRFQDAGKLLLLK